MASFGFLLISSARDLFPQCPPGWPVPGNITDSLDGYGNRKPIYFFLTRAYWTGNDYSRIRSPDTFINERARDEDVVEEEEVVRGDKCPPNTEVKLHNLRKVHSRLFSKEKLVAVQGLSLHIQSDNLLCLLGQNGAGKVWNTRVWDWSVLDHNHSHVDRV